MTYLDEIQERAKTDRIGAAIDFTKGLMRWSESGRLGYTLGNALIFVSEQLDLSTVETAVVAEKVVDPLVTASEAVVHDGIDPLVARWNLRMALAEFGYNPIKA